MLRRHEPSQIAAVYIENGFLPRLWLQILHVRRLAQQLAHLRLKISHRESAVREVVHEVDQEFGLRPLQQRFQHSNADGTPRLRIDEEESERVARPFLDGWQQLREIAV